MGRGGRITRFGDRQSYKPSEVLGLFVISLFLGMFVFGVCILINGLINRFFG